MSYLNLPDKPTNPEQARVLRTGKSLAQLEAEDEAIEQEKRERCDQTMRESVGYMDKKTFVKGERGACREYAQNYSDLVLTDDMCDAVEDGEALVLLELIRREIKSNVRDDILGE